MKDDNKTKKQLIHELTELRSQKAAVPSIEDITRRCMQLEKDNKLLAAIVEFADDAIIVKDLEGIIVSWNHGAEVIYGYTSKEAVGQSISLIMTPAAPDDYKEILAKIVRGESIDHYETQRKRKNGCIIDVSVTVSPVKDASGKITSASIIARDITERKRMESLLMESEKQYRRLFETANDGIVLLEKREGKITHVNPATEKMLGYTKEESIGNKLQDIGVSIDTADFKTIIQNLDENGIINYTDVPVRTKSGRYIDTDIYLVDRALLVQCNIRDITERKQAAEHQRELEERLQRAEKMEALGTLAGGVAHDLNNVLGIVVGYSEMLLDEIDESSPLRNDVMKIMESGQRSAAIVQDLLTLARRGVSGRKVLNLNRLILDYKKSPEWAKLLSCHPSVQIKTDLEADLLNISASSVHLEKALFNLVSNACEAMAKGGGVTVRTTNQYLDKPVHGYDNIREGDYVVLSVSDTGEGIPESDLNRIFEPFYTKKIMGRSGTGLGLAVVWGTVKDHQGYINAESEEGRGTIFTLYFPVAREDIKAESLSVPINEYMGKGESILVVDDVKGQRDLATAMLKKLNYKVASVSSGEDAVEYLREHKVDLLVLDMIMDLGMDGLATYKSVLEIHPKQKAIIVSGFSESDKVRDAQALGAGAYVRKPYVIEKLGLAVREELDRK